jgi:ATP-dependent helicase YprA (DUF1998 family)
VTESVVGYRETLRGQALTVQLEQPLTSVLETVGLWLDIPDALEPDESSLHGVEHALMNALPLALLCDRRDTASSSDAQRVFIYDFAEGGIGLCEKAYLLLENLVSSAAVLLRDCPCSEGCPSCMHVPGCPKGNGTLDKVGGLALLEGHAVAGARAATRILRPDRERGRVVEADAPTRRRRLRAIADDDLRECYGAHPKWLEVGGLAQSASDGLVVVWSIGRGTAEVQPLSGGEPHWVSLRDLAPASAARPRPSG